MKIDQAVRLRELWNASFNMNLKIREEKVNECTLYVRKSEITVACLAILESMVYRMNFQLKEEPCDYIILS